MLLSISLAQIKVKQNNTHNNLDKGEYYFQKAANQGSRLICFPEMWTTGFSFQDNIKNCKEQKKTLERIQYFCKKYKIWHSGSILQDELGMPTNSHFLIDDKGNIISKYNKLHLFSPMKENLFVKPGHQIIDSKTSLGHFGLSTCYDIRFCELFLKLALRGVNIILCPVAFPHPRLQHFLTLIRARAIENQVFIIATNQIGTEDFSNIGMGEITYFGHSCIIDPSGVVLIEGDEKQECLLTYEIDPNYASDLKKKVDYLKDRRNDIY